MNRPMLRQTALALLFCLLPVGASLCLVLPAEGEEKKGVVTVETPEGLRFSLPPDWPVEKRNGVVGPIPLEEYLSRKFDGIEKRLKTLEEKISAIDLRMRVLEEESRKKAPLSS